MQSDASVCQNAGDLKGPILYTISDYLLLWYNTFCIYIYNFFLFVGPSTWKGTRTKRVFQTNLAGAAVILGDVSVPLCDIKKKKKCWFPELHVFQFHFFWKVKQGNEVKDGLSSLVMFSNNSTCQLTLRQSKFASYGTFKTLHSNLHLKWKKRPTYTSSYPLLSHLWTVLLSEIRRTFSHISCDFSSTTFLPTATCDAFKWFSRARRSPQPSIICRCTETFSKRILCVFLGRVNVSASLH